MRMKHLIKQHMQQKEIGTRKIRDLHNMSEFNSAINATNSSGTGGRLVVVNYYSKKCIFSDRSFPILEDICTDYFKEIDFVSVDVDNPLFKTILWQQDITGTPSIRFFISGRLIAGFSGLYEAELRRMIDIHKPINNKQQIKKRHEEEEIDISANYTNSETPTSRPNSKMENFIPSRTVTPCT
jgi:thioredoxin-like negative regulator of GroEL